MSRAFLPAPMMLRTPDSVQYTAIVVRIGSSGGIMSLPSYAMNQPTFPEMYEQRLVRALFRPWAELTLDGLNLMAGDRVLDVACGTGIVARVATERLDGAA